LVGKIRKNKTAKRKKKAKTNSKIKDEKSVVLIVITKRENREHKKKCPAQE